jgi:hypothetical protein
MAKSKKFVAAGKEAAAAGRFEEVYIEVKFLPEANPAPIK